MSIWLLIALMALVTFGVRFVFIAQTVGMDLSLTAQLTIVFTALLASIGTAAVPGAGIIMLVIIILGVFFYANHET